MATRKKSESAEGSAKARVLVSCPLGEPDDLVTVAAAEIEAWSGMIDTHPDAVAYIEGLSNDPA